MVVREKQETLEAINSYLENQTEARRSYLGISAIGFKCDRKIFYMLHWAKDEKLEGRVKRLLRRGQREESSIINYLRLVGVCVTGSQAEIICTPWLRGHCDGIILSGLKESPNQKHILEMKTSNDKAFKELEKEGVKKAKPEHYAQMVCYMHGSGIQRAFYYVVNKNDDSVYTERIHEDEELAQLLIKRSEDIVRSIEPPPRLSESPVWFECKFCQFWGICHNNEPVQHNCRTCKSARFNENGTVTCRGYDITDRFTPCPYYEEVVWN